MAEFDIKKNYYNVLGVSPTSSTEEIKASHIRLALKHHPDTNANQSQLSNATPSKTHSSFVEISEAWSVLSRPDVKAEYDRQRARLYGTSIYNNSDGNHTINNNGTISTTQSGAPMYTAQKENHYSNTLKHASSNWRDLTDKYKTEKWQNLHINERKLIRTRTVTPLSHMVLISASVLIIGTYSAYKYTQTFIKNR